MYPCPFCKQALPPGTFFCKHCKRNLGQAVELLRPLGGTSDSGKAWHSDVERLARRGDVIHAIQVLTKRGVPLAEAKRIAETLRDDPTALVEPLLGAVLGAVEPTQHVDAQTVDKATRIAQQIARLDLASQVLGRKELRELPSILWDDEEPLDIAQGTYNAGIGILVATQKRLIFVDKGFLYGLKVEDFPHDKISSIQYETGIFFGSITIFTSGNKALITNVDKSKCRTFSEGVRARIGAKPSEVTPSPSPPSPPTLDFAAEIEKLAGLRERGLLSDEEFAAAKRKVLGLS